MNNWLEYEKLVIFRDKSKGGLLSQFLKDYKAEFGGSINPSCMKCLNTYYTNFLKKYTMSDKAEHGYILKAKYNGIKSKTTGRPCRNDDLTEAQAIDLIEKHPHGAELFDAIPDAYYKSIEVVSEEVKPEPKKRKKRTPKTTK